MEELNKTANDTANDIEMLLDEKRRRIGNAWNPA